MDENGLRDEEAQDRLNGLDLDTAREHRERDNDR